jgi:16S rRNA (cytosine1402-N4)-methyltransferase
MPEQIEGKAAELFLHVPVMLEEVQGLAAKIQPLSLYIDCTLGAGGHAEALLSMYPDLRCVGIDADPDACERAFGRLSRFAERLSIINAYYDDTLADLCVCSSAGKVLGANLSDLCNSSHAPRASFILFDLGLSSYQLGASGRGFSYSADEPLDMRFSPDAPASAEELIHQLSEAKLADLIYAYGEERYSRRIAHAIVAARKKESIHSAARLASIIADAVPAQYRHGRIHPATRTFQALRIAVNDELGRIERALASALELLAPGGICAVISFHSLEDRIVKHFFAEKAKTGRFSLEWKKPRGPSLEEIKANPPSRSAKFRAIRAVAMRSEQAQGASA